MRKLPVVESRVCGAGVGFRFVNKGFLGLVCRWFWAAEVGRFGRRVDVSLGLENTGICGEGNSV